jgi:hypothetical protein
MAALLPAEATLDPSQHERDDLYFSSPTIHHDIPIMSRAINSEARAPSWYDVVYCTKSITMPLWVGFVVKNLTEGRGCGGFHSSGDAASRC